VIKTLGAWLCLLLIGCQQSADEPQQIRRPIPSHRATIPLEHKQARALHQRFLARSRQGRVELLFLGDSITEAWADQGARVWQSHYANSKAANYGVSGDRTEHLLWRIDNGELAGISPRVLVLMIGTNNASWGHTPLEIAEGVGAIVERIRKQLPRTRILLLGIFPRGAIAEDGPHQLNQRANKLIAQLADGEWIHYLDIGPALLVGGRVTRKVMYDWLHLTEQGYALWAAAMAPKLKALMALPS